jgi:multidrug transporter EmrE-like cation transporter
MIGYVYILITILLTAYGQLVLKWRMNTLGQFPQLLNEQVLFLGKALLDPYIISSFGAAFLASLTWMAALTKFDLSYAYPFMSLAFLVVLIASFFLFQEPLTLHRILGTCLIMAGLLLASR